MPFHIGITQSAFPQYYTTDQGKPKEVKMCLWGAGREFTGTGKSVKSFARAEAEDYEKLLLLLLFISTVLNKNFRLGIKI